jgi:hypothetical protein
VLQLATTTLGSIPGPAPAAKLAARSLFRQSSAQTRLSFRSECRGVTPLNTRCIKFTAYLTYYIASALHWVTQ